MVRTPLSIRTVSSVLHPLNAFAPMVRILPGTRTVRTFVPAKAYAPIEVTLAGSAISVSSPKYSRKVLPLIAMPFSRMQFMEYMREE